MIENEYTKFLTLHLEALEPWFDQIDPTDALILNYVREWLNTTKDVGRRYSRNSKYVWISIPTMIQRLPILKLKRDTVQRKITKLEKLGIIKKKHLTRTTGQKEMYIRIPCYEEE